MCTDTYLEGWYACVHTYIHTYMEDSVHMCTDTFMRDGVHVCINTYMEWWYAYVYRYIHGGWCACVYRYIHERMLCMYQYIHGMVCMCVQIHTYMGEQCAHEGIRTILGVILHHSSTVFTEVVCLIKPRAHQYSKSCKPACSGSPLYPPSKAGIVSIQPLTPRMYRVSEDQNYQPRAFMANS